MSILRCEPRLHTKIPFHYGFMAMLPKTRIKDTRIVLFLFAKQQNETYLSHRKVTALESGEHAFGSHRVETSESSMRFQLGKGHGKQ